MAIFWLALLVALGQTVAIAHGFSHSPDETAAAAAAKHPGGSAHCHLCILAAAVGGAAPPTASLLLATAAQSTPAVVGAVEQLSTPRQRPYAARAPPRLVA